MKTNPQTNKQKQDEREREDFPVLTAPANCEYEYSKIIKHVC